MPEQRRETHAIRFEVPVAALPKDGRPIRFEASEAELEALTRQLRIPAVRSLLADIVVRPWRGGGVRVAGTIEAQTVRDCVVTAEPVDQTVREAIDAVFVPEGSSLARSAPAGGAVVSVDAAGDDPPETFSNDRVDLGPLFCETVALGLDPYPRAPGAAFAAAEPPAEDDSPSPFARLAALATKSVPPVE